MKKWDVVIIGSGISSLTCATLLAKKGKSVCVLESYNKPGGYLHCFNRFGARFDTGAHYVGAMDPGQPFYTLLNYLGVYDKNHFVALDPDGFDILKFPNMQVEFPKGYDATIKRISESFPSEKEAITQYFRKIQVVAKYFPTYEFNADMESPLYMEVIDLSLAKVVEGLTQNRHLRAVLYAYCVLHGVEPKDVSFGMHSIMVDSLIRGPYGFAQGGSAVANKYVERIQELGGEVHLNKRVSKIETEDKIAKAVVTDKGERYEAHWIISGIHPKNTFSLVSDSQIFTPAFRERMGKVKETGGVFGIYGACDIKPPLNPLSNYYYFATDDPDHIFDVGTPTSKPHTVFVSSSNRLANLTDNTFTVNIHASGAMEWFEPWRDSAYGKRDEDYKKLKTDYAEKVFDFVGGFEPELRNSIKKYATSTPVTNLFFNGSREGSPYGIYHSIENTGARAIGPRTHVANLLLTGQSSLFPGLLGASISALRTSGHIIGIKPILKELQEALAHQ